MHVVNHSISTHMSHTIDKNLVYLWSHSITGQRGVYSASSGLKVAYLSGSYQGRTYQHQDKGDNLLVSSLPNHVPGEVIELVFVCPSSDHISLTLMCPGWRVSAAERATVEWTFSSPLIGPGQWTSSQWLL